VWLKLLEYGYNKHAIHGGSQEHCPLPLRALDSRQNQQNARFPKTISATVFSKMAKSA
jgi:hypothetical protein